MKHIEIAISQIGKQEVPIGSNWGEDIKKLLKRIDEWIGWLQKNLQTHIIRSR